MMSKILSSAATLLTLAAALLLFVNVARDLHEDAYVIDEVSLPDRLAKLAPSKDHMAVMLRDEIGRQTRQGYIDYTPQSEPIEVGQPTIKVAGGEFSIAFLTNAVRRAFDRNLKRISGDLSEDAASAACGPQRRVPFGPDDAPRKTPRYHLTLRMSGDPFGPFYDRSGCFDDLLRNGATAALKQFDPVTAAGAMSAQGAEGLNSAMLLVDGNLAALEGGGKQTRSAPDPASKHRALYMRGLIEERLQRYPAAVDDFNRANDAFKELHQPGRLGWHMAEDGLAYAHLQAGNAAKTSIEREKQFDLANEALKQALADQTGYDSALFHQAMIHDFRAEHAFNAARDGTDSPANSSLCAAYEEVKAAGTGYETLLKAHPTFSIAHFYVAVMKLQELTFLQQRKQFRCASMPPENLLPTIAALQQEIDEQLQLRDATNEGEADSLAHLQRVYLYVQELEPTFMQPGEVTGQARAETIDRAKQQLDEVMCTQAASTKNVDDLATKLSQLEAGAAGVAPKNFVPSCPQATN